MDILLTRQPVFDKNQHVYGYELLYKQNEEISPLSENRTCEFAFAFHSEQLNLYMNTLTGGKKVFVNYHPSLLNKGVSSLIPNEFIIVDINEASIPLKDMEEICRSLKEQGYSISMDVSVFVEKYTFLVHYTDLIKVDILSSNDKDQRKWILMFQSNTTKFLAKNIENQEAFKRAILLGYSYFEGYFFSKPDTSETHKLVPYKMNYLQLINSINMEEPDLRELSSIIEKDMAFSYEILRVINTAFYYRRNKIKSIHQALIILGLKELKNWICLAVIRKIGEDRPHEIINYSMMRAKFMEIMAQNLDELQRSSEYMMLGMFSMIDALMNAPLEEVLQTIPLTDETKDILLEKETGTTMQQCYKLMLAYERGNLTDVQALSGKLKLRLSDIYDIYYQSLRWVESISNFKDKG